MSWGAAVERGTRAQPGPRVTTPWPRLRNVWRSCSIVDKLLLLLCPDPVWGLDFLELGYFYVPGAQGLSEQHSNHIGVALD